MKNVAHDPNTGITFCRKHYFNKKYAFFEPKFISINVFHIIDMAQNDIKNVLT